MAQANPPTPSLEEIYSLLRRGLGHEHVNDDNVQALIERAERAREPQIAQQLREWSLPCGEEAPEVPKTIAPTRGFNRENVKH